MEKLILRGVMWGADKVPDHWFEKVPGGFYSPAEESAMEDKERKKQQDTSKHKSDRRSSEANYGDGKRSRRRDRDDGYRSDGHGRKSRGGGSDDSYDTVNDRPRRRRSKPDKYRNGTNGDKPKPSAKQFRNGDPELNGGFSYHDGPIEPPLNPMSPQAASASAASTPVPGPVPYPGPFSPVSNSGSARTSMQPPNFASQSTASGKSTGYVPYANIYGQPQQKPFYPSSSDAGSASYHSMNGQPQPTHFSPPMSETGSVQPNFMNQVAPPVAKQPYQQNPFAQEAPPGMQPAYMPNPYYNPRRFDIPYNDPRYEGSTLDDGTETERLNSRSPSRRRSRRSDRSPDSQDTRTDSRRARSERRRDSRTAPPSRSKSTLRGPFDTSKRSLGWSGVGALYGGLVGSEVGTGGIPTILGGAAVGALGANIVQARAVRKEEAAWAQRAQHAKAGGRSGYYSD